ncbi:MULTISPECIES: toprim domain-containing protein [Muribaculaceae]|uniref:toprim domain-containing protein n=1 Tax=Muribaculaceae TaxID=2005473 RepID=UPI0026365C85|nr:MULTISPECIES: toprim domain-containing protein [Muribaculaceae]
MLKEIKFIPLATFLSQLGHSPVKTQDNRLWYKSPLRQEHTASFKVQTDINCWYDFGIGKGGNIIDLAAELYHSNDLRYLMDCIARCVSVSSSQTVASFSPQRHSAPSFTDIEVVPLRHHALVAYLQERGIPAQIAAEHCKQIHYSCRGKRYYAVGFANESSGYETRNKYFKGCIAPKDITLRRIRDGPTIDVAVFEGFIDYLSALTLGIIKGLDAIILNSVSNVGKAIPYLRDYSTIHCYLDNDNAGKSAFAAISADFVNVIDCSTLYSQFNDLNEFLMNSIQSENTINLISQQI